MRRRGQVIAWVPRKRAPQKEKTSHVQIAPAPVVEPVVSTPPPFIWTEKSFDDIAPRESLERVLPPRSNALTPKVLTKAAGAFVKKSPRLSWGRSFAHPRPRSATQQKAPRRKEPPVSLDLGDELYAKVAERVLKGFKLRRTIRDEQAMTAMLAVANHEALMQENPLVAHATQRLREAVEEARAQKKPVDMRFLQDAVAHVLGELVVLAMDCLEKAESIGEEPMVAKRLPRKRRARFLEPGNPDYDMCLFTWNDTEIYFLVEKGRRRTRIIHAIMDTDRYARWLKGLDSASGTRRASRPPRDD